MQKVGDEQCHASMKGLIQKKKEEIDVMASVTELKRSSPEAEGIPSSAVLSFIRTIEQHVHPMDAVQGFMLLRQLAEDVPIVAGRAPARHVVRLQYRRDLHAVGHHHQADRRVP